VCIFFHATMSRTTTAPTHTCSSPPSAHVFFRILWWSVSCGTDVRMIRAEAPVLFAKACELFILELTLRSSCFSEKTERRNLQKSDILAALHHTPIFDFLDAVVNQPKQ
jgi:hypothetical protein